MYMIRQITPKARKLKGTQTKLRYFKSLGSLNQLKHIMIRKRGDANRAGSAFGFWFMWCFIFCFSLHTGCGHDNPKDKIPTK